MGILVCLYLGFRATPLHGPHGRVRICVHAKVQLLSTPLHESVANSTMSRLYIVEICYYSKNSYRTTSGIAMACGTA
jgi:hypothetical protein